MKSIKQKIMLIVGVMLICVCFCLSATSFINAMNMLQESTQNSMKEIASQTSNTVASLLEGNLKELETMAARSDLIDPNVSKEEKIAVLYSEAQRMGCERTTYIDLNGDSFNGNGKEQNVGDREYFTKAVKGESNFTDPTIGKSTGQLLVFYAVPIKDGEKIIGVLQEVTDGTNLSQLTNRVKYGEYGYAYMVKKDGTIIAHPDDELVLNCENIITKAEEDASYADYARAVSEAIDKKTGFSSYNKDGVNYYIGFAQVEGTDWEVIVEVTRREILRSVQMLLYMTFSGSVFFFIVGIFAVYFFTNKIAKGIIEAANKLEVMAGGELAISFEENSLKSKDEVGTMIKAMKKMSEAFTRAIGNIKNNSESIDNQALSLADSVEEINSASQSVSEAINEIANGVSNQSADIGNVSDIVDEFGEMVSKIVEEIREVDITSNEINKSAISSSEEMKNLSLSVKKVGAVFDNFRKEVDAFGEDVKEINQFTDVITDIADKTNLLALNASIEAARAGEAGRGFAVVAEEIGDLASQSQDSSEKIRDLVSEISEKTNEIVKNSAAMDEELTQQSEVIKASLDAFALIIDSIQQIIPKINHTENSAKELNAKKEVIISNVENISAASLEVSASAEEISASAEQMNKSITEMSNIAVQLKDSVKEMRKSTDEFTV